MQNPTVEDVVLLLRELSGDELEKLITSMTNEMSEPQLKRLLRPLREALLAKARAAGTENNALTRISVQLSEATESGDMAEARRLLAIYESMLGLSSD